MKEFYSLNPAKLLRYQPFLMERVRRENDEVSEIGWINGLYVQYAIGSVLPKGRRYPEQAVQFYSYGDEQQEEQQQFTDADRFFAFATMFNKQFEVKNGKKAAESEETGQTNEVDN